MENCTLYTHETNMQQVLTHLQTHFGEKGVKITGPAHQWEQLMVTTGKTLFRKGNSLTFTYRQRAIPGYQLEHNDDPVVTNLRGMYGFVQGLPADNSKLKELLLAKIATLNTEIGIVGDPAFTEENKTVILELAQKLDGIFFSGDTTIFKTDVQGFWDKTGALLLDVNGRSTATALPVNIDAKYFDGERTASNQALARRERNIAQLNAMNVPTIAWLPAIEDELTVQLRTTREVAIRAAILAAINTVAFGYIEAPEIIGYLQRYHLWEHTTAGEKAFLADPQEELRKRETWKCEDIWVLLWALKKIPALGEMDALCDLNMVPQDVFPFRGPDVDPAAFLDAATELRSATEILDANDLYYRADWACVNARVKKEPSPLPPGLIYERHYALNWLITYRNQEWDDVSCDT
ncbi:DUF4272 domain-containing protein [Chitinophaga sp. Ak27]|uniref:DUF4272 domain-containing protein n=1 Tax=Chitinophaga sp. Ak27 TaxID=2726116 RepID=UPI00145CC0D3|nr:DUF4272 domain-containing protein [Chitinophaga sp. Ak27]NLU95653.1 DUF4272 domain-containing protein [Chitinophaga sp. Ak27]